MAPTPAQTALTNARNGAVVAELPMNMTLPQSSPLIQYTPSSTVENPADGWKTQYGGGEVGQGPSRVGLGSSTIMTQINGGNATVTFNGTAIYIHGRASPDMGYTITLDGQVVNEPLPRNTQLGDAYLAVLTQLRRDQEHTLTLTTKVKTFNRAETSSAQLSIDNVVITAASSMSGGNLVTDSIDASDPAVNSFGLIPEVETRHPSFNGIVAKSDSGPAWASYTFEGSGITITGNTNINQGRYQVVLDGKTSAYSSNSRTFVPNAILFSRGGLDPMATHTVNISTINGAPMGISQFQVSRVEGGTPLDFNLNLSETTPSSAASVPLGIILGSVLGGLALIVIIIIAIVLVVRRRRARAATEAAALEAGMPNGGDKPSPGGASSLHRNDSGRYNSAMYNLFSRSDSTLAPSLAPPMAEKGLPQHVKKASQPRLEVSIPNYRLSSSSANTINALSMPIPAHLNTRPDSFADSIHTIATDDGSVLTLAFQSDSGHTPPGSAAPPETGLSPTSYPEFAQVVPVVAQQQRQMSLLPPPPAAPPGRGRRGSDPPTIEVTEADMADVAITPVVRAPSNSRRVHWAMSQVAEIRTSRD